MGNQNERQEAMKNQCLWAIKIFNIEIFFPLNSYMDFSVIYYIKTSVVAIFSVKPMFSVNPMSVKVMHHCIWHICYFFLLLRK